MLSDYSIVALNWVKSVFNFGVYFFAEDDRSNWELVKRDITFHISDFIVCRTPFVSNAFSSNIHKSFLKILKFPFLYSVTYMSDKKVNKNKNIVLLLVSRTCNKKNGRGEIFNNFYNKIWRLINFLTKRW